MIATTTVAAMDVGTSTRHAAEIAIATTATEETAAAEAMAAGTTGHLVVHHRRLHAMAVMGVLLVIHRRLVATVTTVVATIRLERRGRVTC